MQRKDNPGNPSGQFDVALDTCSDCTHCIVKHGSASCSKGRWKEATKEVYTTAYMLACDLFTSMRDD